MGPHPERPTDPPSWLFCTVTPWVPSTARLISAPVRVLFRTVPPWELSAGYHGCIPTVIPKERFPPPLTVLPLHHSSLVVTHTAADVEVVKGNSAKPVSFPFRVRNVVMRN